MQFSQSRLLYLIYFSLISPKQIMEASKFKLGQVDFTNAVAKGVKIFNVIRFNMDDFQLKQKCSL